MLPNWPVPALFRGPPQCLNGKESAWRKICNPLQHSCLKNPNGQRSLEGYSPKGHKGSNTVEHTAQHRSFWKSCFRSRLSFPSLLFYVVYFYWFEFLQQRAKQRMLSLRSVCKCCYAISPLGDIGGDHVQAPGTTPFPEASSFSNLGVLGRPRGIRWEGGGRGDRDGEYMYIQGWFMSMYDKDHYNTVK